ncbi:hypothetical protein JRI60_00015 [Archangium violaceum]|uniref:hypothetical protein n=1 Tax=Archangium violaceum TaxID=83451 RepID=UPI00194F8631|nr:hypothetical protein [Archangium violaceum]QRN97516.1 hypothetical protein JRI60_00015 [Archangium violaceum]
MTSHPPHSSQDQARRALDALWSEALSQVLEAALIEAQEQENAEAFIASIWPTCSPENLLALAEERPDALIRKRGLPDTLRQVLVRHLVSKVQEPLARALPDNDGVHGGRLRKLVDSRVERRWDEVRRAAEERLEGHPSECLAPPSGIRARALPLLADLCRRECLSAGATGNLEVLRHLKQLTALLTYEGPRAKLAAILQQLEDGRTRRFPYVLRYLSPGDLPRIRRFPSPAGEPTLAGFTPRLLELFPHAARLQSALDRYLRKEGILSRYLDERRPLSPELQQRFDALPELVPTTPGGVLMPKHEALMLSRKHRNSLPDGIVCAVGVGILLEWLLRQALQATRPDCNVKNLRGRQLLERLSARTGLVSPMTLQRLEIVFSQRGLSLRDALSHAAFFADDEALLHETLTGLTQTLASLLEDLERSGHMQLMLTTPRWDGTWTLAPEHATTFQKQFQRQNNLLDIPQVEYLRANLFRLFNDFIPDKRLLAQASFLFFVTSGRRAGAPHSDDERFVSLLGTFIAFEEFLRALLEEQGIDTLLISADGEAVKTELAILAEAPGQLFAQDRRVALYGTGRESDDLALQRNIDAVRALRDLLFHGAWDAWSFPDDYAIHLALKLMMEASFPWHPGAPSS